MLSRRLLPILLIALLAAPVTAQVILPGTVDDTSAGPLLTGVVYVAPANLTVPGGATLTIQPGAIIKFVGARTLTVNGTLNADASGGSPIIFTSDRDDVGLVTDPAAPAPGDWTRIIFTSGADASVLDNVVVRYAGASGNASVVLTSANITMNAVSISDGLADALSLSSNSLPTVTGCTFLSHGARAVDDVPLAAIPGFSACTASGNGAGDFALVTVGTFAGNLTIGPDDLLNGALVSTSNITVAAADTLTLEPGTIVKLVGARTVTVNGTLLANGTAALPVTFTSLDDDLTGGDIAGDGPTSGSPGDWVRLVFTGAADASVLSHTTVRFAGTSGFAGIDLIAADIAMTDCVIEECALDALSLGANSAPTVTGCEFRNNGARAVDDVPLAALPGLSANTASGNGAGDYVRVTVGTFSGSLVIDPDNGIGGVIFADVNWAVAAGDTLTLAEGLIVKWNGARTLTVDGTLFSNGTSADPVVFTCIDDDDFGGDTESNGSTSGAPGDWVRIVCTQASDASVLTNTTVRYAGASGFAGIVLLSADVTMTAVTVQESLADALTLSANSAPVVSGCNFTACGARAIDDVPLGSLAGFSNNVASGNAGGDVVRVTSDTFPSGLTIEPASLIGDVVLVAVNVTVAAGDTLAVDSGVIWKWEGARSLTVNGTLLTTGTAGSPVVFTSSNDDAIGGDTTNDGPTSGAPADWVRIVFTGAADASVLEGTVVRFAGASGFPAVECLSADITMLDCVVESASANALELSTNSRPTVERCRFDACGGVAIDGVKWSALAGLRHNTASGNGGGDYARVTSAALDGTSVVAAYNYPGEVLVVATNTTIGASETLRLERGVNIKFQGALSVTVNGAFDVRGSGVEPITITTLTDDEVGGDTNKDGAATTPFPGAWVRIVYTAGATPAVVEHLRLRYGGTSGFTALESSSPSLVLRSVRVDKANARGFSLSGLVSNPVNLVAFDCGGDGIECGAGAFDVIHPTCAGNAGRGIDWLASWSGNVRNAICWNNAGGNFNVGAMGRVFNSNGEPSLVGIDGNLNVDPQFVDDDPAVGDLSLQATSPCIDAASIAVAMVVKEDHLEHSRILDSQLDGNALPDMGAFERAAFRLDVVGVPQFDTTLSLTVNGSQPAACLVVAGGLFGTEFFAPYGFLLADFSSQLLLLTPLPIPIGFPLTGVIANEPLLEGIEVGVQAVAVPFAAPLFGSFTNLYRVKFFR